jgi:hypothetical protein
VQEQRMIELPLNAKAAERVIQAATEVGGPVAERLLTAAGLISSKAAQSEHVVSAVAPITSAELSKLSLASNSVFGDLRFAAKEDQRLHSAYAMGTDAFAGPNHGRITPWVVHGLGDVVKRLNDQVGIVPSARSFIQRTEEIQTSVADILRRSGGQEIEMDRVLAGEKDLLSHSHLSALTERAKSIAHSDEIRDMEQVGLRRHPRWADDPDNRLGIGRFTDAVNGRFNPELLATLKRIETGLFSREPGGLGEQISIGLVGAIKDAAGIRETPMREIERTFPFDKTLAGRVGNLRKDIGFVLERNGGNPVDIQKLAPSADFDHLAPAQRPSYAAWRRGIFDRFGMIENTEYLTSGPQKGLWQHSNADGAKLISTGVRTRLEDQAGVVSLHYDGLRMSNPDKSTTFRTVEPDGVSIERIGRRDPNRVVFDERDQQDLSATYIWDRTAVSSPDGNTHLIDNVTPTHRTITILNNSTGAREVIAL